MKKIFTRLFFLFAFILTVAAGAFAQTLNINSLIYDDSVSFLSINSFDNENFQFDSKPVLNIDAEGKKAYFDISPAVLNTQTQNLVINSTEINQITVSQQSRNPDVVRVAFAYNEGFNPANVSLQKLNSSLFLRFKNTQISNYYFQGVYLEGAVADFYEPVGIQTPVKVSGDSLLGQINSAFDIGTEKNFVLVKKNLLLPTKYYLDNITFHSGLPVIFGIGSYTLSKPFYLTNPNRVVFDVKNSIVNPSIRNKTYDLGDGDTLKIGQFNQNTSRIVITSQNPEKYAPVIYADTQRLGFSNTAERKNTNRRQISMTSSKYEKISSNIHAVKLVFNNPLVFEINRTANELILNLYDIGNYVVDSIRKSIDKTPFSEVKISEAKDGIVKIVFPVTEGDFFDIHLGSDGKTLRIRETFKQEKKSDQTIDTQMPAIDIQSVIPAIHKDGKKYVVIDPGHGGSDCGALRGNIYEKDITLDVSKRVEKLLKKKGYVVEMTRTTDKTVSLQERVDISEAVMPDVFVSIHVNSSNSESPSGLETHYYKDNSLDLAKNVHAALINNINSNDRGLFKSKFYVINHTTAPAILVEMGFISNPKERAQLVSESRKEATAKAIADGIDDYFRK